MLKLIQIVFLFLFIGAINAQELNCTISINADKVPGSNKQVFATLESSLNEFVNQKRWTNLSYKLQEKINCNLTITILEQTGSDFKGHIQIQSSRPVFNSSYLTPVFNYKDDNFSFQYTEYESLQFNQNSFESNLVSVVTFYMYVVLGMDADTFTLNGGTSYYSIAQNIVVQAQQSGYVGWNQNDGSKTRFKLIDNLVSPTYSSFRSAIYQYHRNGLDLMSSDLKNAKENINESISIFKSIYDARPDAFLLRIFTDSKADEIVNIFSDGPRFDTSNLKENLMKISPINAGKWNEIK
ncbi:MAG: DUF4835 family protein [Lutibacter sp.]|nr:DUF4835 family protein [Lutibacter sp.]